MCDIENKKSTQCPISCGIPQWSILGPLLYLIYVNDIDKSTMGNILSFSEDISLYIYLIQTLQIYLEHQTLKSKIYITGSVQTG